MTDAKTHRGRRVTRGYETIGLDAAEHARFVADCEAMSTSFWDRYAEMWQRAEDGEYVPGITETH